MNPPDPTPNSSTPAPWTRDGHWIGEGPEPAPDTPGYPRLRSRCGGPGLCPDCAADQQATAVPPDTTAAPDPRQPSPALASVDPWLARQLRALADEYGALGVALAAARLTDPAALVHRLQTQLLTPGAPPVPPAPQSPTDLRVDISDVVRVSPAPQNPPLVRPDPEHLARRFHETYERLAPEYGYRTREASAVPWPQVPETNRRLMIAVVAELCDLFTAPPPVEVSLHHTATGLFERGEVEILGQVGDKTHVLARIDPRDVSPAFVSHIMRSIGDLIGTDQARAATETAAARHLAAEAADPGPHGYRWAAAATPAGRVWHLVRGDWPLPAPARCGRRVTHGPTDTPEPGAQPCRDCAPTEPDRPQWTPPPAEHDHPLARALADTVPGLDPWHPGEIAAAVQALGGRSSDGLGVDPAQALTDRLHQAAADAAALAELHTTHTRALTDLQRHRDAIRAAWPALQHWWRTAALPLLDAMQRQLADLGLTADASARERRRFDDPDHAYAELIVIEREDDHEDWHLAGCLDCPWATSGLRDVCEQAGHAHVLDDHLTTAPDTEDTRRGQD